MTTNAPSLGYVRETWRHMSAVSGFDALYTSMQQQHPGRVSTVELPCADGPPGPALRLWSLAKRLIGREQSAPDAPSPFFAPRYEKAGLNVIRFLREHPGSLVLLSAGENQYSATLCNAADEIQRRLVVCFHQPVAWHRLHWRRPDVYAKAGAIITLCADQAAFFRGVTQQPVIEIKHGVDLRHFTPKTQATAGSAIKLLFVGQWLRDFETLAQSMEQVWRWRPDITIDCVVPRVAREHEALLRLARDSRARWHCDLTPDALSALYQNASLLFLPVLDATANNAVLEAVSSGLPVISSRVGGLEHYLPDSCGLLATPHCATSHVEALRTMIEDAERLATARRECREFALQHLHWQHIGKTLLDSLGPVWPVDHPALPEPTSCLSPLATARAA